VRPAGLQLGHGRVYDPELALSNLERCVGDQRRRVAQKCGRRASAENRFPWNRVAHVGDDVVVDLDRVRADHRWSMESAVYSIPGRVAAMLTIVEHGDVPTLPAGRDPGSNPKTSDTVFALGDIPQYRNLVPWAPYRSFDPGINLVTRIVDG